MYVHKATPHRILSDDIAFNYDWMVTNNVGQQVAFIQKVKGLAYPFLIKTDNTYVLVTGFGKYIEVPYTKIFDFLGSDTHVDTVEILEGYSIEGVKELFGEIHPEPPVGQGVWSLNLPPVEPVNPYKGLSSSPLASLIKDLEASAAKPKYSWTVGKHGVSFKQQTIKDEIAF